MTSRVEQVASPPPAAAFKKTAYRLYLSHWLSTWNARVFEFGSVLYLAKAFPGTLMTMSIYAFVRGLSAIALASAIGTYIDREDRLKVVRTSIGKFFLSVTAADEGSGTTRRRHRVVPRIPRPGQGRDCKRSPHELDPYPRHSTGVR